MVFVSIILGITVIYGIGLFFHDEEAKQLSVFIKAFLAGFAIFLLLGLVMLVEGLGYFQHKDIDAIGFVKIFIVSVLVGVCAGLKALFPEMN